MTGVPSPDSYLRSVAPVMFPPGSVGRRFIAVLSWYLDLGKNRDTVALAGYVSAVEKWVKFNRLWRKKLRKAEVGDHFHMTDFNAGKDVYSNWSKKRRDALIGRLLYLIEGTAIFGISAAIVRKDYAALSPDERKRLGSLYSLCATKVLSLAARWAKQVGASAPIAYVFERGDEGSGQFDETIHRLLRKSPKLAAELRLGTLSFGDKRDWPGLQAADILAFESCRHLPRVIGLDPQAERDVMFALRSRIKHRSFYLDAAGLRRELSLMTPDRFAEDRKKFGIPLDWPRK